MKVGDLVKLFPSHYKNCLVDLVIGDENNLINNSFGIIMDENPKYFFVQWNNNPLYDNAFVAHLKSELEVVSDG